MHDDALKLVKQHPKYINLDLQRTYDALECLNNPHLKLKNVIHIAGTNGKGSVKTYMTNILVKAGYKVHVFTSPHIQHLNERILLNNRPISNTLLKEYLTDIKQACQDISLSFFELLTIAFFVACANEESDYIVIETGLGGTHDATNVLPDALLTIITSISYDHTQFLGESIKDIAKSKAGIIKPSTTLIASPQEEKIVKYILMDTAYDKESEFYIGMRDFHYHRNELTDDWFFHDSNGTLLLQPLKMAAEYQHENAATAIMAARYLNSRYLADISDDIICDAVPETTMPARMQYLDGRILQTINANKTKELEWQVILDGCHNFDGAHRVAQECLKRYDDYHIYIFLSLLTTKNIVNFVRPFLMFTRGWYTLPIAGEDNDVPPQELAKTLEDFSVSNVTVCDSIKDAVDKLKKIQTYKPSLLLIIGSLYQAGNILNYDQGLYDGKNFNSDDDEFKIMAMLH